MSAEEVLFHGQEVALVSGERIFVNPWGVKTGRRMIRRVKVIWQVYRDAARGQLDLEQLLDSSYDELIAIVADSIGVKASDLEDEGRFLLEDVLALLAAIVEVNFTKRPEFMAKALALFRAFEGPAEGAETKDQSTPEKPTSGLQLP
jgi:hypothetical protein